MRKKTYTHTHTQYKISFIHKKGKHYNIVIVKQFDVKERFNFFGGYEFPNNASIEHIRASSLSLTVEAFTKYSCIIFVYER